MSPPFTRFRTVSLVKTIGVEGGGTSATFETKRRHSPIHWGPAQFEHTAMPTQTRRSTYDAAGAQERQSVVAVEIF